MCLPVLQPPTSYLTWSAQQQQVGRATFEVKEGGLAVDPAQAA